uniref:Uncharacterized protein n=1 Tax=Cacopsylla melanoneura TaxID=428564 RepID=A0A8D8WHY5_9HEMI
MEIFSHFVFLTLLGKNCQLYLEIFMQNPMEQLKEMGSVPDYTVIASSELTYLKINRDLYSAGLNASSIARARERAKQRGEDSAMSFPPSPDLPRDDRFSSLYQTTSYESIPAQERERQDSTRRITFKKEDHREESPGKS